MSEMSTFRKANRRLTAASIIINLIGAVAASNYLEYIHPLPSEQPVEGELEVASAALSLAVLVAVFGFAFLVSRRGNRRVGLWYERIRRGSRRRPAGGIKQPRESGRPNRRDVAGDGAVHQPRLW